MSRDEPGGGPEWPAAGARALGAAALLLGAAAGAWLVAPVFRGGALLNQDHPIHFQRLWGFLATGQGALVPSWNPFLNAGRPYFHAYPVLFHALARLACAGAEPVLAYKLAVALVHALGAVSAYALLAAARRPLAGCFAATLFLVAPGSPQSGGFAQLFLAGLAPSSLATALVPLALAAALRLLEAPGRRRAALAAAAAAAVLLAHPVSFAVYALGLAAVLAVHARAGHVRARVLLLLPALAAGLAAFWWVPVAVRRLEGHFVSAFAAATVARSTYSAELFRKYFWSPLHKPLLVAAAAGLAVALLSRGPGARARRAIAALAPVVPLLLAVELAWPRLYELVPLRSLVQLQRLPADLHALLIVLAALALDALVRLRPGRAGLVLGAAGLLALGLPLARRSADLSRQVVTLDPATRELHAELYRVLARHPGRVLHEEALFRLPPPLGRTHVEALLPTYHRGESLSFDSFGFREDWGFEDLEDVLRRHGGDATARAAFFRRLNVRWVVSASASARSLLAGLERIGQVGPWTVHGTGVRPGWFEVTGGELVEGDYRQLSGRARVRASGEARLLVKVHDYPNWRVTVDGAGARRVNPRGGLLEVAVPPGEHEVAFVYALTRLDLGAYAASAASALLALWLLRP